tara:strand:+ start:421 stop:927 length:507 start_codon:yes stop_codon:yes gene_type:complete
MATQSRDIDDDTEDDAPAPFEVEASDLDETTHAECLVLYRDSEDNIRFSKGLQWKTLGGTLAIFAILGVAGINSDHRESYLKTLIVISWAISAGAIYAISILQSWQNTEREKLRRIVGEFSNLFRMVYRIKSRTEANIHRYILLAFMVITMLIGNYVLATILTPLFDK